MSRRTWQRVRVDPRILRQMEAERLRLEEESRRASLRRELGSLGGELAGLGKELETVRTGAEDLEKKGEGHPVAAPALASLTARVRAVEALLADRPALSDRADSGALAAARDRLARLLTDARSRLRAAKDYSAHVARLVAEAKDESRRQEFEKAVFEAAKAAPAQAGASAPAAPTQAQVPATTPAQAAELARASLEAYDLVIEIGSDLPPDLRPAFDEAVGAVSLYSSRGQTTPDYSIAQIKEVERGLRQLARKTEERRAERQALFAEMTAALDGLETALAGWPGPAPEDVVAILAALDSSRQKLWPEAAAARRWCESAGAAVAYLRERALAEAQRRRIMTEAEAVLSDLDYEVVGEQLYLSPHGGGVVIEVGPDGSLLSEAVDLAEPGISPVPLTPTKAQALSTQTKAWCGDYRVLAERLGERGIVLGEGGNDESDLEHLKTVEVSGEVCRRAGELGSTTAEGRRRRRAPEAGRASGLPE